MKYIIIILSLLIGFYFIVLYPKYSKCPPIDISTLALPTNMAFAQELFSAKAQRLNDSGQCVIEGSWGSGHQKYYITVSPTAQVKNAQILRFTYEELKN